MDQNMLLSLSSNSTQRDLGEVETPASWTWKHLGLRASGRKSRLTWGRYGWQAVYLSACTLLRACSAAYVPRCVHPGEY